MGRYKYYCMDKVMDFKDKKIAVFRYENEFNEHAEIFNLPIYKTTFWSNGQTMTKLMVFRENIEFIFIKKE